MYVLKLLFSSGKPILNHTKAKPFFIIRFCLSRGRIWSKWSYNVWLIVFHLIIYHLYILYRSVYSYIKYMNNFTKFSIKYMYIGRYILLFINCSILMWHDEMFAAVPCITTPAATDLKVVRSFIQHSTSRFLHDRIHNR